MNKYFILVLLTLGVFPMASKGAAPSPDRNASNKTVYLSKKEIKKEQKHQKRIKKVNKWLDKHQDKIEKLKQQTNISDDYLRWTLIALAAAVGLAILSIFAGFLWFFAALAAVASAVFFILWLLEYA